MTEREQVRHQFRVGLFKRRGLTPEAAQALADRLVERDADRDDRRVCAECKHVTADHPKYGRGCFAARQGWIKGASKHLGPLMTVLQRCPAFQWQTP